MKEKEEVVENEEEEEAVCGRVAVHSQAAKIEVITEKILEMNTRGDSRIKKEKELFEENKCNNFYISDFIGRVKMVQQFRIRGVISDRSTILCIRVGIMFKNHVSPLLPPLQI